MLHSFLDQLPTFRQILAIGPPAVALAAVYLYVAGALKRDRGWPTGYTRKVFHFLVFSTAASVQILFGLGPLLVFGAATSAVIFYALMRGDGDVLFEAMARESDAPWRARFVVVPYAATLIGGVTSNLLFGGDAIVGYLVAGLGDAVGEPVGTRFGRHRFRVPTFAGTPSYRSWEGSAAVFAVSFAGVLLAQTTLRESSGGIAPALVIAVLSTAVEAVSPHGWDNLTMQVVPSALAAYLLR